MLKNMNGINIQYPWSNLLVNGYKCVETRSYPIPKKYIGEPLAIIETPGKSGTFKARIIGTITFSHSFKYKDYSEWANDYNRHKVEENDPCFSYNENKQKYGWVVSNVTKFKKPIDPPKRRGIIFTKNCGILENTNDRTRVA
jgi:hypothetical protein